MSLARVAMRQRILLIDDEPFALALLKQQLVGLGYEQVVPCAAPADGLASLQGDAGGFEVVFCDLRMPGMDGVEFLRHLGRLGYAGSLILTSGVEDRVLQTAKKLAQAHGLNVRGCLCKPISPAALRALLATDPLNGVTKPHAPGKRYTAHELRRAIHHRELFNYYQPKVVVSTGEVAGVETLVRWQHPQDGVLFPDQFVEVAEEHGLIDELTRAVLIEAMGQLKRWQGGGLDLPVAVNLSMDNLGDLDFPDFLDREAAAAQIDLSRLVLEVTESRLMKNYPDVLDILLRLRLKGVGLSIDDFGTGHSSLTQLRDLPFDELKVDRSFVHGAGEDRYLGAIFEAPAGMARRLGITMVAEGVEDQADWRFLRRVGCDLAQGYFIAKPMPASAVPGWVEQWNRRHRGVSRCLR